MESKKKTKLKSSIEMMRFLKADIQSMRQIARVPVILKRLLAS